MLAVIFKATLAKLDEEYSLAAARMRERAFALYGCLDFITVSEGNQEVAISYWPDEASIQRWKNDPEHLLAQKTGRTRWYQSYTIEVVEVLRAYTEMGSDP